MDQSKQAGETITQRGNGNRMIGGVAGRVERLAQPRLTEGGQPYPLQLRVPGAGCRRLNS